MRRYYPTESTCRLRGSRSRRAEGKRRYVRTLFATIADRYDFITVVLSYGQDRRWKRRLVASGGAAAPAPRALDLATGTGDIAFALAARGAHVVGLDITPRMIELASDQGVALARRPAFLVGDMLALPFPAASFDIVTTGYGLRNVPDLAARHRRDRARAEARRPGAVARFQSAVERLVRAVYLCVPHRRRRRAGMVAAPRPGHLPLHSSVDPAVSGCCRGRADDGAARLLARRVITRCWAD